LSQGLALLYGASVLPYDGVRQRLTGTAVPKHSGFTLIGNRDRTDVIWRCCGGQNLFDDLELRLPNFEGVVLNPARLWKVLLKLALSRTNTLAMRIEQNCARASSALIECEDVCHRSFGVS